MNTDFSQLQMIDEIQEQKDLFDEMLDQASQSSFPSSAADSFELPQIPVIHHELPKVGKIPEEPRTVKKVFCTCTKSQCQQRYCPCYKEGEKCGIECTCNGCKNQVFIPRRIKYIFGSTTQLSLPPFSFSE